MSWGEVQKQDVSFFTTKIEGGERPSLNPNPFARCCVPRIVLADVNSDDSLKNDFNAPIVFLPVIYTAAMTLQKKVNSVWTHKANLIDDTYGELHQYRTKNNITPYSYKVEWKKVLETFGSGSYRVAFDYSINVIYSDEFCLEQYTEDSADESVRFEFMRDSVTGSKVQDITRDFVGLEHKDQIRLYRASFGNRSASFEVESNRLKSGLEDTYKKEFREKYECEILGIKISSLKVLLYDMGLADWIKVTDYNSINEDTFSNHYVEIEGAFEPSYNVGVATQSVLINFVDKYNNNRKLYS